MAVPGADLVSVCLVSEELAKASPSFAGMLTVQMVLCPKTVEILGTEAQKQRILPKNSSGERLMAYSQSEPGGAANIGTHLTKILPDGNGYRIDGAKLFCTQGTAKTYLVMGKSRDRHGNEGYGCVIVEREDEGFRVEPYENKLGWRGTNTGPISFDNVFLTEDDILGNLLTGGFSHRPANQANLFAHVATSVGCAQGLFDKTIDYVKQRRLYNKDMAELQPIGYWLAEAHAKIVACRDLLYTAVREFEAGTMAPEKPNICKAFIGETDVRCLRQTGADVGRQRHHEFDRRQSLHARCPGQMRGGGRDRNALCDHRQPAAAWPADIGAQEHRQDGGLIMIDEIIRQPVTTLDMIAQALIARCRQAGRDRGRRRAADRRRVCRRDQPLSAIFRRA